MPADDLFRQKLAHLDSQGLRRRLRTIDATQGPRVIIDGRSVICLCSNNYLGLANHPALIEAACRAARDYGTGAGASRLISGSMRIHREFEERLAAFKGTEACVLFNSGYHANVGTLTALIGENDAVFSDELNHASLIDGCRLSRARVHVYRHGDVESLERELQRSKGRHRLIVTDSLFSMDGDAAPLPEICNLAERHGAMVMVDEAHATGAVGPRGAGLVEALGLGHRVTVQMGTLGKALGSFGAYVAGSRALVDYLVNAARPLIFTTALPPPVIAAAAAALDIVEKEPERRQRLREHAATLRAGLHQAGYSVEPSGSHIIPVLVGDPVRTMRISEALLDLGVFAHGIRPPTVPPGTARIRATVMATHSDADLRQAIAAFARVRALE